MFNAEIDQDQAQSLRGKGKKKKKRSQEKQTGTKFGKIASAKSPHSRMVNIGSSQSGTDLAASAGDDITGSKSLTDLADLPVPVNRSNKKQVVSGWDDDGLVDDWNFDEIDKPKE